jgi:hypothetical protein
MVSYERKENRRRLFQTNGLRNDSALALLEISAPPNAYVCLAAISSRLELHLQMVIISCELFLRVLDKPVFLSNGVGKAKHLILSK